MRIRPHSSQKGIAPSKVRVWTIDTYGETHACGAPLPRKRVKFEGTRRAAEKAASKLLASLHAEPAPLLRGAPKPSLTLLQYVRRTYLPSIRVPSTKATRGRHLENHILPILGPLTLDSANTREAVARLRSYLEGRTFKPSFRNLILTTYSSVLAHAVEEELLGEKVRVKLFPEDRVSEAVPLNGYRTGHLRAKRFTDEETAQLLATASTMPNPAWWTVLVLLGAAAGCRAGEAAARKWADIDWSGRRIRIDSKICGETGIEVPATKNGISEWVHLSDELLAALKSLTPETEYVLGGTSKRPYLTVNNLEDRFAVLTKRAFGEPSWNYHRLRHTCASALSDRGAPAEQIRLILRHKSLRTTYGYVTPSQASLQLAVSSLKYSINQ